MPTPLPDASIVRELPTPDIPEEKVGWSDAKNLAWIEIIENRRTVPASYLERKSDNSKRALDSAFLYADPDVGIYSGTAAGTDYRHHVMRSYLKGYVPFQTENLWIPLLTLAKRKAYQLDELQYSGKKDIWQTSREAYRFTRGDCEDHAIALADWLIEMGEDARVVLGKYKNTGHAWVILFRDGNALLLEATGKRLYLSLSQYPLAEMHPEYHPVAMFNRENFWQNTGSSFTTRYDDEKWKLMSHYLAEI